MVYILHIHPVKRGTTASIESDSITSIVAGN
jgi:hypothetical protein